MAIVGTWENGVRSGIRTLGMLIASLALCLASAASAGTDMWTTIGPIGGGIVYVAEDLNDPTLLYASSFNPTRLFRSRDGGTSWEPAASPGTGVSMSFIPGNGSIYAIDSSGIAFKSTDGGFSWEVLTLSPERLQIKVSEPGNPQVVYGIAFTGGVKSIDGGATWTVLPTGVPDFGGWLGMLIDSNSPSTVYIYGYSRVMKSLDAGATWSVVNTGLGVFEVSAMTQFGTTLLIATFDKGLFRSSDGGATWQPLNGSLTDLRIYSLANGAGTLPVLFATVGTADSLQGATDSLALMRSVDGGNSWIPTGATGVDRVVVSRLTPNRVYGVRMDTVAVSNDAGDTWTAASLSSGLPNARVPQLLVGGGNTPALYASVDGAMNVARSVNAGGTWSPMRSPGGNSLTLIAVSPTRSGIVYARDDRTAITSRSDDFGVTWTPLFAPGFYPRAIEEAARRPRTVYAAGEAFAGGARIPEFRPVVWRSDNGGESWSEITPERRYVVGIAVAPTDERTVYAYTHPDLFWTNDGGRSWINRGAALSGGVGALVVSPTQARTAYASSYGAPGSTRGVYVTFNGGASWSARNQGLPDARVTALAIDPHDPSILYAVLEGLGVFRTADAGDHWVPIAAGLGGNAGRTVNSIAIEPADSNKLYVGTNDGAYALTYANYDAVGHAIEFYQAAFDHYFIATETQVDVIALDSALIPGWSRTARTFPVFPLATSGTLPVCRFFSGQTYAPKSSHFYTPYVTECASLKQGSVWHYEGDVFGLALPLGSEGQRTCPMGTGPLYRAYNNGMGGAPNHRYTTDIRVLNQMVAQGWAMEGEAQTQVFACVPM